MYNRLDTYKTDKKIQKCSKNGQLCLNSPNLLRYYNIMSSFRNENKMLVQLSVNELVEIVKDILRDELSKQKDQQPELKKQDEYLTISEVMEKFHVSRSTVYRWKQENILIPQKIGRNIRYSEKEVSLLFSRNKFPN